jgi:hypothetical protein
MDKFADKMIKTIIKNIKKSLGSTGIYAMLDVANRPSLTKKNLIYVFLWTKFLKSGQHKKDFFLNQTKQSFFNEKR